MPDILKAIFSRRMLRTLLMGFSCGLPLLLTISVLQAWMKEEGVDLTVIGLMALVGLPYTVKFLWAPFLDRFTLPFTPQIEHPVAFFNDTKLFLYFLKLIYRPGRVLVLSGLAGIVVSPKGFCYDGTIQRSRFK